MCDADTIVILVVDWEFIAVGSEAINTPAPTHEGVVREEYMLLWQQVTQIVILDGKRGSFAIYGYNFDSVDG